MKEAFKNFFLALPELTSLCSANRWGVTWDLEFSCFSGKKILKKILLRRDVGRKQVLAGKQLHLFIKAARRRSSILFLPLGDRTKKTEGDIGCHGDI